MKIYKDSYGFTLVEVLVSLVIIMSISSVAYRHHLSVVHQNRALAKMQAELFLSESQYDLDFGVLD